MHVCVCVTAVRTELDFRALEVSRFARKIDTISRQELQLKRVTAGFTTNVTAAAAAAHETLYDCGLADAGVADKHQLDDRQVNAGQQLRALLFYFGLCRISSKAGHPLEASASSSSRH